MFKYSQKSLQSESAKVTEEDLDALAKEMNIDLEKEANQKLPSQAKENDMEELKNKVFLDSHSPFSRSMPGRQEVCRERP